MSRVFIDIEAQENEFHCLDMIREFRWLWELINMQNKIISCMFYYDYDTK